MKSVVFGVVFELSPVFARDKSRPAALVRVDGMTAGVNYNGHTQRISGIATTSTTTDSGKPTFQ
jgi:hypothetical protein